MSSFLLMNIYIYKMNTIELVTERYYKQAQANFTRGRVSVFDDFEISSAFYLNIYSNFF